MDRFFRLAPSCAVLICVLAALPGCSTLKETSVWKKTSGLYYTLFSETIVSYFLQHLYEVVLLSSFRILFQRRRISDL